MDNLIIISNINDFLFCPVSIYFHNLMDESDRMLSQSSCQINGTHAHRSIDEHKYSTKSNILQGMNIFCEKYGIIGKIDLFDSKVGILTERKKKVSMIFDGLRFQTYAQYFSLVEMGYEVNKMVIHSMDDNRSYQIGIPTEDSILLTYFEKTIEDMHNFDPSLYLQTNLKKCENCIYEPMCGSSCLDG